jgi:hypothetical protein
MPDNYTPTATYGADPVAVPASGEGILVATAFAPVKEALNRAAWLKDLAETNEGRLDAALTKLGITVVNPADTALPTYAAPFLLVGNKSHQTALETLDSGLSTHNTAITYIATNVGGNVDTATPDAYSSTVYIINGDSLHTAIGKLDGAANTINTAASNANALATANTTRISNIVTKLGVDADLTAGWTYGSTNFISNGQTLKVNVESIDKTMLGARRTAHRAFWFSAEQALDIVTLQETLTNAEVFWDDFYDTTKVNVASTCTTDVQQQKCYGDSTILLESFTSVTTQSEIKIVWQGTGGITVKANLIGSTSDPQFTTVSTQDTWVTPASGSGTGVVVKFELGVGAELYNFYAITKP